MSGSAPEPGRERRVPAWETELVAIWRQGHLRGMVGEDAEAQLSHAKALARHLDPPARALDLGSGAGIPGLALAGCWPRSRWWLLDAARRRVRFLEEAVARLGWAGRVTVVHGRAEDLGRTDLRGGFDLVTCRSFGPPAVALECGAPFLRIGGILAVTEPPGAEGERWPSASLASLGLEALDPRPGVQRLLLRAPIDDRFPRRAGIPAKRPLF